MIDEAYVCLFVCFFLFVCLSSHSKIFLTYGDVTITGEGLRILTVAVAQWGFFSVSHLLWHGASVYNGHLQVPLTLITIAERLAV